MTTLLWDCHKCGNEWTAEDVDYCPKCGGIGHIAEVHDTPIMNKHEAFLREQASGPMSQNPEHIEICNKLTAAADELMLHVAEVKRLGWHCDQYHKTVSKLPMTKDGAYAVPGMKVYYPIIGGGRDGEIIQEWVNSQLNVVSDRPTIKTRIYSWFSTRYAAESEAATKGGE